MVVDQIEVEGTTILKSEGEPPIPADRQAPAALELAFLLMQPVAWKPTQIVERVGCVNLGQQTPQPLGLVGANATGVIVLEQPSKAFVAKALDGHCEIRM